MKLPNDRIWTYSEGIDYFIPIVFIGAVMLLIGVPWLAMSAYFASTCIWAIVKYKQ